MVRLDCKCEAAKLSFATIFRLGRDGGTGRRSGLKIRRGLSPRGGSTPPPGTKKYLLQNVFSSSGGGLSRKEPPRRAAPRKSAAASVIPLTSGAVPQRCRGCQNRTAGCCWAREW